MPTTATNQPAGAKKPHARASVQSESVRLRSRNTEEYTVAQSAGLIVSTTEARLQLIAETAYQIAERRGLVAGNELDDGLIAER